MAKRQLAGAGLMAASFAFAFGSVSACSSDVTSGALNGSLREGGAAGSSSASGGSLSGASGNTGKGGSPSGGGGGTNAGGREAAGGNASTGGGGGSAGRSAGGGSGTGGASSTDGGAPCGGRRGLACGADEFCDYGTGPSCGAADNGGVCRKRPAICTDDCPGACGCDGKFYCNACGANAAGTDITSDTTCLSP